MNMRWWVNSDRKQFLSLSLSHTRTVKDSILPVNVYYEWILHYKHTKRGEMWDSTQKTWTKKITSHKFSRIRPMISNYCNLRLQHYIIIYAILWLQAVILLQDATQHYH